MNATHLTGLDGNNPIGFFAALGVQVAFASEAEQPSLWWSDDITPHAVVDGDFTINRIADQAIKISRQWAGSAFMRPRRPDGTDMPKGNELKLTPEDLRTYLGQTLANEPGSYLITALVAEGSLDGNGLAKPTDLNFTSGTQFFLTIAREILGQASREDVLEGLAGPWRYSNKKISSLKWDISDDRQYALRAKKPNDKKPTNPGPEALAVLGLSLHPVFARQGRTLTQGCSGSWGKGYYSWPLWRKPARPYAVKSLLAHAYHPESADPKHSRTAEDRKRWFRSWGVSTILKVAIERPRPSLYGQFRPPKVVWRESPSL